MTLPTLSPSSHAAPSSAVTCARTDMYLGDLVLQDEEANFLAMQVVHESLVTHYSLLQDFCANQATQGLCVLGGFCPTVSIVWVGPASIK